MREVIQSGCLTETQIKRRQKYITASEVPAICGVSPFQSAYDVFLSKTLELDPIEPSDAMDAGHYAEMAVLAFCQDKLRVLRDDPDLSLSRSHQFRVHANGIMSVTRDASINGELTGIEAKTMGLVHPNADFSDWGDEMTDDIPDHVIFQCHAHMACMGPQCREVYVPIWLSWKGFKLYLVQRVDSLVTYIEESCQGFMTNHVYPNLPPSDVRPSLETLKRIRRGDYDMNVALDDGMFVEYHKAQVRRDRANEVYDARKAQILAAMETARWACSPAGHSVRIGRVKETKNRKGYDMTKIKVNEAALTLA